MKGISNIGPEPYVRNEFHAGKFTLYIYARHYLTEDELELNAQEWLLINNKKSYPKSGKATIATTFGDEFF